MASARERMKLAHAKKNEQQAAPVMRMNIPVQTNDEQEAKVVEEVEQLEETAVEEQVVEETVAQEVAPTERFEPPVQQEPVRRPIPQAVSPKLDNSSYPTGVVQIARPDVDPSVYGRKAVATNFNCYNKEVFEWMRSFSSNNQFNGGVPITKSQLIEVILDVVMYDLDIKPIGYASQQELREDIQYRIQQRQQEQDQG